MLPFGSSMQLRFGRLPGSCRRFGTIMGCRSFGCRWSAFDEGKDLGRANPPGTSLMNTTCGFCSVLAS